MIIGAARPGIWLLALMAAFAVAPAATGREQGAIPASPSPLERRAREYLELVNSGTEAQASDYVRKNFAPAALEQVTPEDRIEDVAILRALVGRCDFVRLEARSPSAGTAIIRNRLLGRLQKVAVEIEAGEPHRLLALGLPETLPGLPKRPRNDGERIEMLDAFLTRLSKAGAFSGTVLLAREGVPVFQRAYGIAENRFQVPNRVDTRFYVASITKSFTAVAAGQLVEQGKLSWEDPLAKFIPGFPDAEAGSKIRIKHLLSHTSGLTNTPYPPGPRIASQARSVAAMVEAAPKNPLLFEPGARYQYNNLGFLLLGRIVEIASGKNYYEYIRDNVFGPAGMTSAGMDYYDQVPRLAYPYETPPSLDRPSRLLDGRLYVPARPLPFGGSYGTAGDLLKFDRALFSGRLIRPSTLKLMTTAKPELNSPYYGYGFGLAETDLPGRLGRQVIGHGGNTVGVCVLWRRVMDRGVPFTYVVLSNSGQRACFPAAEYILDLFPAEPSRPPAAGK